MKLRLLVLLIFLGTGYARSQESIKILFVGNSLTYYNDLPALVEKEAANKGIKIDTKLVARPNYAIIDHLEDGEIQKLLKSGVYNYVIVQQGPSSQPEGRQMLIEDGQKLAKLCNDIDAKLCFFMVWPSLNYYSTFDDVIKSHVLAAEASKAMLLPVGASWKEYIDATRDYSYYGPDGFHPSLEGSNVAAQIIVAELFK